MHAPLYMLKPGSGKIVSWHIEVKKLAPGHGAAILTMAGQVGGKIKTTPQTIKIGKNIGKANETTPFEQACLEATAKWTKKKKKGYTEDPSGISNVQLPMKALNFRDAEHRVVYPADAQPKLNGVRCDVERVSENKVTYKSNEGNYFETLEHLTPYFLDFLAIGDKRDGEIYVHGWMFQQIIRAVKKIRADTAKLQFHSYDVSIENVPSHERLWMNEATTPMGHPLIKIVKAVPIFSREEFLKYHDDCVKQGYEGAMIRNRRGLYIFNGRPADLQKYKNFFEKEVTIIGHEVEVVEKFSEETGIITAMECVIFKVRDEFDNVFTSVPKGGQLRRNKWLNEMDVLLGKKLTIAYQEFSEDNVPIFNVGKAIRDYE